MARIPTRFDLSMTPAGRFLQLQQPQTPRPQSQVIARDALGRISAAGPRLPSAGPQPDQPAPFGFRKDVMDRLAGTQPTMGAVPPPPPPKKPMSFMDRISPELGTPASAGLGAAAATGLQLSGYSPTPISTAQGLGAMMQSGMQAYTAEKKAQAAAELAKQQRDTDIRLKMMEIAATQGKASAEAGKLVTDREMKRSEQFRTASRPFGEARLNYERVVANATTKRPTGATDIALIFNFMKMLDPTSVVRESEFQAAANASPLMRRLGAEYNKLFKDEAEKLPEETRRQFFQAATETYVPYVEGQQRLEQDFMSEAERFNLNPENIVRTKVPKMGAKEYPYIVYDIVDAENLPDGAWVMLGGELLQVSK